MINKIKTSLFMITPLLLCVLSSCGETPLSELQQAFKSLQNNNFTVDYYDSFVQHNNNMRNQKYYFTEYSIESDGDLGFSALAQKDETVFRYNIVDESIISSSPLINYNTGIRYSNIYEYTYGMQDFDYTYLNSEKDSDGYYTYVHDQNINNDRIFQAIFLKQSYTGINPEEIKIKIVKDVIYIDAVILTYDISEEEFYQDTVRTVIYNIGKTENKLIKTYLDEGKTYKKPLDLDFYELIHPYLFTHNYSIDFNAEGMGSNFKMTEYSTESAVLDVSSNGINHGYIYEQDAVSEFVLDGDKIKITGTPLADSSGNFYGSLFNGIISYSLMDLNYDNFIGYKDDVDDNVYYLTDSELIYMLSYISYIEVYEEQYCDLVRFEILDRENHEFKLTFNLYNKQANKELGTYEARFYDLNKTSIPQVDRYKNIGTNPLLQSKDDFIYVMNEFSKGNYSMDSLTPAGLSKIYFTEKYFYEVTYSNEYNNLGLIKQGDSIYEVNVTSSGINVDTSIDLGKEGGIKLPGCGDYYFASNDLGYISHFDQGLYNFENYRKDKICGVDVWKLTDTELSKRLFSYITVNDNLHNLGVGFIVSKSVNTYDMRVTLLVGFLSNDGYEGYVTTTFYDIGGTCFEPLENYLK